jgi:DNA invertase Pin-like site-specific DNA recombinase
MSTTHLRGRAVAYTRRSTDRQDLSHAAQLRAIRAARPDLTHVEDTCSGGTPFHERPGGARALALLRSGEADTLVVSKLDRMCRSVLDGASLIEQAEGEGWSIVCLDLGMDTSTPMGRAMAHVALAFAEVERERIRERTREGLAEAKAQGATLGGRRFATPDDVVATIVLLKHVHGLSLQAIADRLNEDGVPTTLNGGKWWPSTVAGVLRRAASS